MARTNEPFTLVSALFSPLIHHFSQISPTGMLLASPPDRKLTPMAVPPVASL